jgi:SWI/SNF-related matrix-associated actin-dependent regulator of chromatin subfamily A containing DEAD/H box 1
MLDLSTSSSPQQKSKGESAESETTAVELSQIDRAKRIMKPFILRRWKKDVLTFLPPKKENLIKVQMSEKQQLQYSNMVATYKSDEGIIQATQDISGMTIMMNMRKLACHPLLLR